jgi:hypothetical protein
MIIELHLSNLLYFSLALLLVNVRSLLDVQVFGYLLEIIRQFVYLPLDALVWLNDALDLYLVGPTCAFKDFLNKSVQIDLSDAEEQVLHESWRVSVLTDVEDQLLHEVIGEELIFFPVLFLFHLLLREEVQLNLYFHQVLNMQCALHNILILVLQVDSHCRLGELLILVLLVLTLHLQVVVQVIYLEHLSLRLQLVLNVSETFLSYLQA